MNQLSGLSSSVISVESLLWVNTPSKPDLFLAWPDLFLTGLEVVIIAYSFNIFVAALLAIVIALGARFVVVGLTTKGLQKQLDLPEGAWKVLTWGGLRGGISVALVLQLPVGPERDVLLALTYAVVIFSILVQGLSIGKVAQSLPKEKTNPYN